MTSKNLMQMLTDIVKLDRFDGGSFKRWQKKMQFLLATLNVAYFLTKSYPKESKNETLGASHERPKFENDDFICRGHILNVVSHQLFNVYQKYFTAKELWNALEERYFTEDATNLGKQLLIEEQYRLENKANDDTSKVHAVEEKGESSKVGHFKRECRALKKKQDGGNDNKNKDNNFVSMIFETFSLEKERSWWVDSRATRHVCNDETMFKTYEPSNSMLYMRNHSTAQVKGKGKIDLAFTSGNTLTLKDVLHVSDVRKNLVSRSILNKFGIKLVFESDKFILFKGGKFVSKGYHTSGMLKLNIKDVVNSSVNDVNMTEVRGANNVSASIVTDNDGINKIHTSYAYINSSLLWHARLGHVYFKRMRNMANANLIPKLNFKNDKCQTCMHTKITRLPFPTIQRTSKILELVHSDVCDLHATPTIGGKKYFATFIYDYARYCYVYLLYSKDEVLEKFKIYKNEVELKCETKIKCLRTHRVGEYYDPRYFGAKKINNYKGKATFTTTFEPCGEDVLRVSERTCPLTERVNEIKNVDGEGKISWLYYALYLPIPHSLATVLLHMYVGDHSELLHC
ncbi:zinc finger, CCHC-type containing protein [Tanacetum coccineum]